MVHEGMTVWTVPGIYFHASAASAQSLYIRFRGRVTLKLVAHKESIVRRRNKIVRQRLSHVLVDVLMSRVSHTISLAKQVVH